MPINKNVFIALALCLVAAQTGCSSSDCEACKTARPQLLLISCYSDLQNHHEQTFRFSALMSPTGRSPWFWVLELSFFEVTSFLSVHLQSCMPKISRVMENKRLMFPQVDVRKRSLLSVDCLLDLGPSLITVASYPTTVPIQQHPRIFLVACAKTAHNSTQRPLCCALALNVPG